MVLPPRTKTSTMLPHLIKDGCIAASSHCPDVFEEMFADNIRDIHIWLIQQAQNQTIMWVQGSREIAGTGNKCVNTTKARTENFLSPENFLQGKIFFSQNCSERPVNHLKSFIREHFLDFEIFHPRNRGNFKIYLLP